MAMLRVLPDADRVEAAMLEAAQASGFVEGGSFRSFGQLVESLEGARFLKRRPCSALTARIVLWSVARELKPNPFGAFVHEPAFARAALELIFDIKSGMLAPDGFEQAVRELGAARQHRARALAALYEAYEARMLKLGLADREDIVRGALERLRAEGLPAQLGRYEGIALQGVYDFPASRLALMIALAEALKANNLSLTIELPGAGVAPIDAAVDGVLAELERRHAELPNLDAHKEDRLGAGRPLARLAAALFSDAKPLEMPGAQALTVVALPSARAEARELARVARGHLDRGVAPERIALCYRDLGEEAEWLEESLAEMGVPARVRRGAPLSATAVGRLALGLPLLVDDAYPASEVAGVLTNRYARAVSRPLLDAPARSFAAASVRDDVLGAEGPRGAYEVRLTALAQRLEARDGAGAKQARQTLDRCQRLFRMVGRIPEQGRALELLERWWKCVDEIGVLEAIRQPEQRDAEGSALGAAVLRALARDQAAADALRDLTAELDAALKLSGAGTERMHRRTFHRWLVDAATDFNLVPAGPRAGAVRVLDVRELAGRDFDAVCVGGVVDGRFPARELPHALFSDEDRRAVNRWARRDAFRVAGGEPGARAPWRLAEDRLLLYLALTSSKGPVVLSYSRTGPSGAEQIPSPFLDELARLASQRIEARPLAPIRALADVETELELRSRVALEAFAPRTLRTTEPELEAGHALAPFQAETWVRRTEALVEIERERLRFFSDPARAPGPFSGAVLDPALLPAVREAFSFSSRHPLAATALGRFGNCAFQGFLEFVLRLREPDEPGEELDSRGRGSFWHGVLERLFPVLKERGLLGRSADEVPEELIDQALEAAATDLEADTHVGHPVLWKLGRQSAHAMVRRLLATDHHGMPLEAHTPAHAELRFGWPDSPQGWREVAVPVSHGAPVYLRGSIDRVDRGLSSAAVLDYKTGGLYLARLKEELLISSFQIPVYLHALRQSGHQGAVDGAWLSLKDGSPVRLEKVLEGQTATELLSVDPAVRGELAKLGKKNLANAVEGIVQGLRAGQFAARPHDCEWCSYRAICRISDRKLEENFGG